MTSQIITASIDEQYPIAGQDNDSEGFRQNFSAIKTGLETAKSEIEGLQTNAVLVATLDTSEVVSNDLLGSELKNGFHVNFHGQSYINDAEPSQTISVALGDVQQFTLAANTAFTFRDWPADGKYAVVRVHLKSSSSTNHEATFFTENGGVVVLESTFTDPLIVTDSSIHQVIEAWSYTNGATVFVRNIGTF